MYPQKFLNFEKVLRIDYYFIFLILIISHFTHTCRYIQQFHIVKDSFYFYSMWNTRSRGTRQIYQIHQIFRVQSHGEISFPSCAYGEEDGSRSHLYANLSQVEKTVHTVYSDVLKFKTLSQELATPGDNETWNYVKKRVARIWRGCV